MYTLRISHKLTYRFELFNIITVSGVDFSVKIWDCKKGIMLQSFTTHTGPVTKLFLPPIEATVRSIYYCKWIDLDYFDPER